MHFLNSFSSPGREVFTHFLDEEPRPGGRTVCLVPQGSASLFQRPEGGKDIWVAHRKSWPARWRGLGFTCLGERNQKKLAGKPAVNSR